MTTADVEAIRRQASEVEACFARKRQEAYVTPTMAEQYEQTRKWAEQCMDLADEVLRLQALRNVELVQAFRDLEAILAAVEIGRIEAAIKTREEKHG